MATNFNDWFTRFQSDQLGRQQNPFFDPSYDPNNPQAGQNETSGQQYIASKYSGANDPAFLRAAAQEYGRLQSVDNSFKLPSNLDPQSVLNYGAQRGQFQVATQPSGDNVLDKTMNVAVPAFIAYAMGGAAGAAMGGAAEGGAAAEGSTATATDASTGQYAGETASSGSAGASSNSANFWNNTYAANNIGTMNDASVIDGPPPASNGPMNGSIMSNPALNDPTAGIDLSNTFGQSVLPSSSAGGLNGLLGGAEGPLTGGGAGVTADVASGAGGASIFDQMQGFLNNNPILSKIGGSALQALVTHQLSNKLNNVANNANNSPGTRALTEPERAPYQARLDQLISNPSQYLNNDPFATSLAAYYKNNVIPRNVAQSGNPASVLDQQGSQFVNAISQNYNTQAQTLGGLGGFNMGPSGYAPVAYSQPATLSAQYGSQPLSTLGGLLGQNLAQPANGTSGTTGIFGTKVS